MSVTPIEEATTTAARTERIATGDRLFGRKMKTRRKRKIKRKKRRKMRMRRTLNTTNHRH